MLSNVRTEIFSVHSPLSLKLTDVHTTHEYQILQVPRLTRDDS